MTEAEARNKLIKVAKSYIGSDQYSSNHAELVSIFNSVKPDGYTLKRSDPWCAGGLSAAAIQAFGKNVAKKYFPLSASCPMMITKAKKLDIWIENDAHKPKKGESILYDWDDSGRGNNTGNPDHVGLCVEVNGSTIKVLEFNHHGSVGYREIEVNGRYIRGYFSPDYAAIAKALTKDEPKKPATKKKSNAEIAKEVIAGKWGNGDERKKKLEAAGYNYKDVQNEVNKILVDKSNEVKYKCMFNMNVRSANTTKSKVLRVIKKGTVVTANKIKNSWLYSEKYEGWICIKDSKETYLKKVN